MSNITEWNADAVVSEITAAVVANMETAAQVVETDARRRLMAIADPEWGTAYRRSLAMWGLTSVVVVGQREIEAGVGLPGGKAGHDGFYIEVGSRTAPAQPWLRPALATNLRRIVALIGGR